MASTDKFCAAAGTNQCRTLAEPQTLRLVAETALHQLTAGIAQCLGTLGPGTPPRGRLQGEQSVSWLHSVLLARQPPFSTHMLGVPSIKLQCRTGNCTRLPKHPLSAQPCSICGLTWGDSCHPASPAEVQPRRRGKSSIWCLTAGRTGARRHGRVKATTGRAWAHCCAALLAGLPR